MGLKQFGDFLHEIADLHKHLADYYSQCSDSENNEEVRVQLAHLARTEQHMERCVHEYAHNAPKTLRETWLRTTPDIDLQRLVKSFPTGPTVTCADRLEVSLLVQDELEKIFEKLIHLADDPEIESALQCLLQMEKEEKTKILRSTSFY